MKLIYPVFFLVLSIALPAAANPISKTGQLTCYDSTGTAISCTGTGQDAELKVGADWPSPRFRDNGNETVTDTLTSLTWPKDTATFGPGVCTPNVVKTWQEAIDFVKCLNTNQYLGSTNWHLPNISELNTLVHYGMSNTDWLTYHGGFRSISNSGYWSSTTDISDTKMAWAFSLQSGQKSSTNKLTGLNVIPVKANADLIVTSIGSPMSANTGQVLIPVTVRNNGSVTAKCNNQLIYTRLYLSTDNTYSIDDIPIGYTSINFTATSTAPGAEWTRTASATIPAVSPGLYYICAFADADKVVEESDEANNTTCESISINR